MCGLAQDALWSGGHPRGPFRGRAVTGPISPLPVSIERCWEESVTNILHCDNPNILLLWKASSRHPHEALLILNKDIWHHQDFYTDNFRHFIQSGEPLKDVSPEYPLDYIHEPFHYGLRPGQGIVLVPPRR